MFNKIKSRLSEVFSKTNDVIEENDNNKTKDDENYEEEFEHQEVEDSLTQQQEEFDSTEQKAEDEIQDVESDIEELDSVDQEKQEDYKQKELDSEEKEIDELDDKVEHEVEDVERDVEELDNVDEYEKQQYDSHPNNDKKGFFSGLFSKKKKEQTTDENRDLEDEIKPEEAVKNKQTQQVDEQRDEEVEKEESEIAQGDESEKKEGFLHSAFSSITQKTINENDFKKIWVELELFLLEINVAYEIVEKIEKKMHSTIIGYKFSRISLNKKIKSVLIDEVTNSMYTRQGEFDIVLNEFLQEKQPVVIMMLGVNGTGKTTTIAKIIKHLQNSEKSVVVAAADTYRAAAVEQLDEHCQKLQVKCVKHKQGSDPAAVCYDAIDHAKAKNIDVVLVDTAGRMPNNSNLMDELKKIKRVSHTDMVMFIGDSVSGNDLIDQIELFDKGLGVTGVVLTKVDTDERPGSVVTTAYSINSPIYFLGTGQTYDDLVAFDARRVAEQLFSEEEL